MASLQHLRIINTSYCLGEEVLFTPFSRLPAELRLCIWEISIERHRFLQIEVEPPSESGHVPPFSTTNALNKLISGRNYTATVQGLQLHRKLLRVNRESRQVALGFYRV